MKYIVSPSSSVIVIIVIMSMRFRPPFRWKMVIVHCCRLLFNHTYCCTYTILFGADTHKKWDPGILGSQGTFIKITKLRNILGDFLRKWQMVHLTLFNFHYMRLFHHLYPKLEIFWRNFCESSKMEISDLRNLDHFLRVWFGVSQSCIMQPCCNFSVISPQLENLTKFIFWPEKKNIWRGDWTKHKPDA